MHKQILFLIVNDVILVVVYFPDLKIYLLSSLIVVIDWFNDENLLVLDKEYDGYPTYFKKPLNFVLIKDIYVHSS
jgi:hypothetical protein